MELKRLIAWIVEDIRYEITNEGWFVFLTHWLPYLVGFFTLLTACAALLFASLFYKELPWSGRVIGALGSVGGVVVAYLWLEGYYREKESIIDKRKRR